MHSSNNAHSPEDYRPSEAEMRSLLSALTDVILVLDSEGRYLKVMPTAPQLLYRSATELLGRTLHEVFSEARADEFLGYIRGALRDHQPVEAEYMLAIGGADLWFHATLTPLSRHTVLWVARDITEARRAAEALRQAEAKYRSIFENAVEGIFQTSPEGRFLDVNPALARLYGYLSPEELIGTVQDIAAQVYAEPGRREEFVRQMLDHDEVLGFESRVRRKDGGMVWISENVRAVRDDAGRLLYYEGTVEEITARKLAQDQLQYDAFHDKLTGLANRALFMDRLGRAMTRFRRHSDDLFAVLFLDFDRFKTVNDSLGHDAGDQFLINVAGRLEKCLRPSDTVARLGGDEFSILLEDVGGVQDAVQVAERIQHELTASFLLRGQEQFTSASIGIALSQKEYESADDMLRNADIAMYRAKSLGRARHELFDGRIHLRSTGVLRLDTDLRRSIERGELRVVYQPIITLATGRISGFEALVRWQHPERGLVGPDEFIPLAEESGFVIPMDRWVLRLACAQLQEWQQHFSPAEPWTMGVNFSGKQFFQSDLVQQVTTTLADTGLSSQYLKVEITESVIMSNAETATSTLLGLRDIGVELGIDDFGTGYSSLSYLHRFPVHALKIDRSFVTRIASAEGRDEIVGTIITLAHSLKMDVIAEGIETSEQLKHLRALRCKHGQGFLIAEPLEPPQVAALLAQDPQW